MSTKRSVILLIERSRAYGRGLLRGISRYAADHGPWLFHLPPEFYRASSRRPTKWLREFNADGAIAHVADVRIIESVRALGIPAVIGGMRERVADLHAVVTDDVAIGRVEGRIFSVASPDKPADFKARGLSCGFVKVSQALPSGTRITLKDQRRSLPVTIVEDIRPHRTARAPIRSMLG